MTPSRSPYTTDSVSSLIRVVSTELTAHFLSNLKRYSDNPTYYLLLADPKIPIELHTAISTVLRNNLPVPASTEPPTGRPSQ